MMARSMTGRVFLNSEMIQEINKATFNTNNYWLILLASTIP